MLAGFKPFEVLSGSAFMSVSNTGINFNKNVLLKMHKCRYIKVLINYENATLAIQKANADDDFAISFVKDVTQCDKGVRIHNKELENTIARLVDLDLKSFTYRVDGELLPSDDAMLFNLNAGRRIKKRTRK